MDANKIANIIFFPGVICHEIAHIFACVLLNVPIHKIKLIGKEGGYVVHDDSKSYKIIVISLIPFVFNILVSFICARVVLLENDIIVKIIAVWIALSVLYFCLPSAQDVKNVLSVLKRSYFKKQNLFLFILKILLLPITLIVIILVIFFRIVDKSIIMRLILLLTWIYLFLI
jgi:hypothetical protein